MQKWTKDEVIDYFDSFWDCTMSDLSRLSGWTVQELKRVLLYRNTLSEN